MSYQETMSSIILMHSLSTHAVQTGWGTVFKSPMFISTHSCISTKTVFQKKNRLILNMIEIFMKLQYKYYKTHTHIHEWKKSYLSTQEMATSGWSTEWLFIFLHHRNRFRHEFPIWMYPERNLFTVSDYVQR